MRTDALKNLVSTACNSVAKNCSDDVNSTLAKGRRTITKPLPPDTFHKTTGKTQDAKQSAIKKGWEKIKNALKNKTDDSVSTKKVLKNIPDEYKPIFANLEGKSGQEFADTAYDNMVEYMDLKGIAPKKIIIDGSDGAISITGGFDPVKNTISYSEGFLKKLPQSKQMNLISHELTHCGQYSDMLRTEGIGVEKYARTLAENSVKKVIDGSDISNIFIKLQYDKAVEKGQGEEFIQSITDATTKDIIEKIETNFSQVLKMPKIDANSPRGLRAAELLEAQRNYEGLGFLGIGSKEYKNNPIEVEAYAFGDKMEELFEKFMS